MLETVHFTVIYMIYDNHKFFWTIKTRKLTPQNARKSDDDDVAPNLRYIMIVVSKNFSLSSSKINT